MLGDFIMIYFFFWPEVFLHHDTVRALVDVFEQILDGTYAPNHLDVYVGSIFQ